MILRPFFSYYGAKFNLAALYPRPQFGHIIEPFAGSACYSLRYSDRRVTLYELDDKVFGVWEYLISAKQSEISVLPIKVECVDDHPELPQEARWLIGFWLGRARQQPARNAGSWVKLYGVGSRRQHSGIWGLRARARIAAQVPHIKHWRVIHGDYRSSDSAAGAATWFIDPPYRGRAGTRYKHGSTALDYGALSTWCQCRVGQVIVCEQSGADWLPFLPLARANGMRGTKTELCWLNNGDHIRQQMPLFPVAGTARLNDRGD